jgi:preprotein translocase subunit SecA
VDNQLRGRSGRQGDPGSSRFFLSLEDNLMRIFASERVKGIMQKLGMEKGQAIEAKIVSKSIENAQRKVEGHNYDIRKNLLEYDDVANDQRKVVYQQRSELLEGEDVQESVESIRFDVVDSIISRYVPPQSLDEQWDIPGLTASLEEEFGLELEIQSWLDNDDKLFEEPLRERIQTEVDRTLKTKESLIGAENMRKLERDVMLHVLDEEWKEHLASMDYLRQSVGLRGYAQKNPKQEYKREAFEMFEDLLDRIKLKVVSFLMKIQITQESPEEVAPPEPSEMPMEYSHAKASNILGDESAQDTGGNTDRTYQRIGEKVGRNDPCPCGSGKKFKQCHGQLK